MKIYTESQNKVHDAWCTFSHVLAECQKQSPFTRFCNGLDYKLTLPSIEGTVLLLEGCRHFCKIANVSNPANDICQPKPVVRTISHELVIQFLTFTPYFSNIVMHLCSLQLLLTIFMTTTLRLDILLAQRSTRKKWLVDLDWRMVVVEVVTVLHDPLLPECRELLESFSQNRHVSVASCSSLLWAQAITSAQQIHNRCSKYTQLSNTVNSF